MLRAESIEFGYGRDRAVLRGVSAAFPPGVVTAVVGPNGAGKSTLLRVLSGVALPERGGVKLGERPLEALARRERAGRVALVPQQSDVAFAFAVREVVRLGRYASERAGSSESAAAVGAAIERVGLTERADDPFATLSAGQRQRVTLARALAQLDLAGQSPECNGKYLLADEPVAAMDPANGLRAMRLLRDLADRGLGVVCVLHDLMLVLRYATGVVMLGSDGRVAAAGRVEETLIPETLGRVFGVDFDPVRQDGRVAALLPREGVVDTLTP